MKGEAVRAAADAGVDDVAQLGMAAGAADLGASHTVGAVLQIVDRFWERVAEARPAASVIEFCLALEPRISARRTAVNSFVLYTVGMSGEGTRGAIPKIKTVRSMRDAAGLTDDDLRRLR
jgi:hypothetical protein